uniref:tetratricopeptide repeat protein n=1 Tax=Flavobacterium sp. TaxID=239 RepID=UPI00404B21C7
MNTYDLTYLLNKPEAINEKQTMALEPVLHQFPYFQAARALHLKGLLNQESFRYNYELKKTAAYTLDRSILFHFITNTNFETLQKYLIEDNLDSINNISVNETTIIEELSIENKTSEEETIFTLKEIEESLKFEFREITPEESLEIGKPLLFEKNEKHSFQEWLNLTKFEPIIRETNTETEEIDIEKQKKAEIIDKFIELNPRISPIKENTKNPLNIHISKEEPTHLMTETLAKVYLEQKKYTKAIQAYEILILKYPEKSSFFANRIKNIKDLQQNN